MGSNFNGRRLLFVFGLVVVCAVCLFISEPASSLSVRTLNKRDSGESAGASGEQHHHDSDGSSRSAKDDFDDDDSSKDDNEGGGDSTSAPDVTEEPSSTTGSPTTTGSPSITGVPPASWLRTGEIQQDTGSAKPKGADENSRSDIDKEEIGSGRDGSSSTPGPETSASKGDSRSSAAAAAASDDGDTSSDSDDSSSSSSSSSGSRSADLVSTTEKPSDSGSKSGLSEGPAGSRSGSLDHQDDKDGHSRGDPESTAAQTESAGHSRSGLKVGTDHPEGSRASDKGRKKSNDDDEDDDEDDDDDDEEKDSKKPKVLRTFAHGTRAKNTKNPKPVARPYFPKRKGNHTNHSTHTTAAPANQTGKAEYLIYKSKTEMPLIGTTAAPIKAALTSNSTSTTAGPIKSVLIANETSTTAAPMKAIPISNSTSVKPDVPTRKPTGIPTSRKPVGPKPHSTTKQPGTGGNTSGRPKGPIVPVARNHKQVGKTQACPGSVKLQQECLCNYKEMKDSDKLLAVVITKRGGFKGRRINSKAFTAFMNPKSDNNITKEHSDYMNYVFPAGHYYFPSPIRFQNLRTTYP